MDAHPLVSPLYEYDQCTVKQYGDRFKLTYFRGGKRVAGVEAPPRPRPEPQENAPDAGRFDSSLSRSRARVFELALCNPWEYFCTWTVSSEKYNRYNLDAWHKDFSQWLRNLRRNHSARLAYLIIPEQHKDGAWHMHGLMMGVPSQFLRPFVKAENLPYKILQKLDKGEQVFDWPAYRQKYGWVTVETLRDKGRAASYIAKYVTKAFLLSGPTGLEHGRHLYYCSRGLEQAQLVRQECYHIPEDYQWDYQNDYVCVRWADTDSFGLDSLDEATYIWNEDKGKADEDNEAWNSVCLP